MNVIALLDLAAFILIVGIFIYLLKEIYRS